MLQGAYIWPTGFLVAGVQQFLIYLSSSFFEKKNSVVQFQTRFLYMNIPKTGDVLFVEHRKSVIHKIWHQIRIPRLFYTSCTLKPVNNFYFGKKFTCRPVFFSKKIGVVHFGQKKAVVQIYVPVFLPLKWRHRVAKFNIFFIQTTLNFLLYHMQTKIIWISSIS